MFNYQSGDGLAWLSSDVPSSDPTPLDPLALRLALAKPARNAAYLARPCGVLRASLSPASALKFGR
jgi:hypothetical protein